jgi:FkbM family methyltransferase
MTKEYRGPLAWFRRWNYQRVERRRWLRELFRAIPANDAALLEGMTRLLERGAEETSGRVAWQATADQRLDTLAGQLETRLGALDEQLDALGVQLTASLRGIASAHDPVEKAAADTFPVMPTARHMLLDPELDLLMGLAPWLSPRTAIDVGAHLGTFSEALLAVGFEVHALEPNPATFDELVRRLGSRPGFKAHQLAAGSSDGEADLRLVRDPTGNYIDPSQFASLSGLPPPPGLVSTGTVRVKVRRLDSLVRDLGISAPSFVKVDAEGTDLEVMRGLGALRPALLQVEFWDEELPFSAPGATNRVPDFVELARQYGMPWHLVVFRRWGDDRAAFYTGRSGSPERSWGNVYFFSDHSLYDRARKILEVTLPEARFVSARHP